MLFPSQTVFETMRKCVIFPHQVEKISLGRSSANVYRAHDAEVQRTEDLPSGIQTV